LKCEKFSVVIGEIRDISLTASRRFTLAIEQSRVTGFIVRHQHQPKDLNPIFSTARWRITSLPGRPVDGMAGLGFPHWNVELLKLRSGKPGQWQVEWRADHFEVIEEKQHSAVTLPLGKTAS
jgi:protein ImuA